MVDFNEADLFDKDVNGAVAQILNKYQNGDLTKDEYPLALLNLYGMMLVSQLKRQADMAAEINEQLANIKEHLFQIEINTRK